MSRLTKELHYEAFNTHFELACFASIVVILADMCWLLHDIIVNGLSVWYCCIGTVMIIGLIWTGYIVYKHHKLVMCELSHKRLVTKLKIHKHKAKHRRS